MLTSAEMSSYSLVLRVWSLLFPSWTSLIPSCKAFEFKFSPRLPGHSQLLLSSSWEGVLLLRASQLPGLLSLLPSSPQEPARKGLIKSICEESLREA